MDDTLHVMVVEDEETLRLVFSQVLSEDGFRITEAASGEEALALISHDVPHIVVTDIRMGGMSGLQLLDEIKKSHPDTQVIILTSHASVDLTITALRSGAYDYLLKPVDELDIISTTVSRAAEKVHLIHENRSLLEQLKAANQALLESNEALSQLATRDGLTGLFNHRFFQDALAKELSRSRRQNNPFSLLFIDVDYFKKYNDSNGHPMGDTLLKEVAQVLLSCVRDSDLVARYGGEEFVVILPVAARDGAMVVAEKIRQGIENSPFSGCETMPFGKITVSIGIASYPEAGEDAPVLLNYADQALYRAKHSGRNRVC